MLHFIKWNELVKVVETINENKSQLSALKAINHNVTLHNLITVIQAFKQDKIHNVMSKLTYKISDFAENSFKGMKFGQINFDSIAGKIIEMINECITDTQKTYRENELKRIETQNMHLITARDKTERSNNLAKLLHSINKKPLNQSSSDIEVTIGSARKRKLDEFHSSNRTLSTHDESKILTANPSQMSQKNPYESVSTFKNLNNADSMMNIDSTNQLSK